jgi:serine/threonine-protein phosphatase PP1 catalytic subunit
MTRMHSDRGLVTDIYETLLSHERLIEGAHVQLDPDALVRICHLAIEHRLKAQPALLELAPPLVVVGDIHGQFVDLLRYLRMLGPPRAQRYLFLGDYVDRGYNSLETVTLLFCAQLLFAGNVSLLRGNHETRDLSHLYGFEAECTDLYGAAKGRVVWGAFNDAFDYLPLAARVGGRIFCVHGGISQELPSVGALLDASPFRRPLDPPETGPVMDLLWADPSTKCPGYAPSDRGASSTFGIEAVEDFLCENGLDLIVRAHQVVKAGYEFPFEPVRSVVTVFSCPNYAYEYPNDGAVLLVDGALGCAWRILKCRETYESFLERIAAEREAAPGGGADGRPPPPGPGPSPSRGVARPPPQGPEPAQRRKAGARPPPDQAAGAGAHGDGEKARAPPRDRAPADESSNRGKSDPPEDHQHDPHGASPRPPPGLPRRIGSNPLSRATPASAEDLPLESDEARRRKKK